MPPTIQQPDYVTNICLQKGFSGGIDTISSDTEIATNAYLWCINGRNRLNRVVPIKKHKLLTNAPTGKKQGIRAIGNVLILFVDGKAYWRQEDSEDIWHVIPSFQMSSTVKEYWTEAVPASYFNFVRKTDSSENIHAAITVTTDFKISGTKAGIVVQDGVSQPFIIFYDDVNQMFSARRLHTYLEWKNNSTTQDDREYVPVGKQMMYLGGILYVVAADGKSVYRSVTGRPLDFMVNVKTDGTRMTTEKDGGAQTVSFAFDFDEITCLYPVNIPNSFIYATEHNVRIITADFTNTIFGEPTYYSSAIIQAGIVNYKSVLELVGNGDYAFVDFENVISFNAVQQNKFNGRNSVFSLNLSKFTIGVRQKNPCCVTFDNNALFSIDSNYGNLIAVYDLLTEKWVSLDITDISRIKQFAVTETVDKTRLYCITEYDEVFQMFASDSEVYTCCLKTRSWVADETNTEHKCQHFRPMFNGGTFDGVVTVIEYVDEKISPIGGDAKKRLTKQLKGVISATRYPIIPPVIPDSHNRVDNPSFVMKDGLTGKKLSYIIRWNNNAELVEYELVTTWKKGNSSHRETAKTLERTYGPNS